MNKSPERDLVELPFIEQLLSMGSALAGQHAPSLSPWILEGETTVSREEINQEVERRGEALVPQLGPVWEDFSAALDDLPVEYAEAGRAVLESARSIDTKLPKYVQLVVKISQAAAQLDLVWLAIGPGQDAVPAGE